MQFICDDCFVCYLKTIFTKLKFTVVRGKTWSFTLREEYGLKVLEKDTGENIWT
jgi:hypothetical protein